MCCGGGIICTAMAESAGIVNQTSPRKVEAEGRYGLSGINYEVISQCGHYLVKQANIGAEYFYSSRLFAVQVKPNEVGHAPGGYRFKTDDCANFVSFLFFEAKFRIHQNLCRCGCTWTFDVVCDLWHSCLRG